MPAPAAVDGGRRHARQQRRGVLINVQLAERRRVATSPASIGANRSRPACPAQPNKRQRAMIFGPHFGGRGRRALTTAVAAPPERFAGVIAGIAVLALTHPESASCRPCPPAGSGRRVSSAVAYQRCRYGQRLCSAASRLCAAAARLSAPTATTAGKCLRRSWSANPCKRVLLKARLRAWGSARGSCDVVVGSLAWGFGRNAVSSLRFGLLKVQDEAGSYSVAHVQGIRSRSG